MSMEHVLAKIDSLVVQNAINALQHILVSPIVKVDRFTICNHVPYMLILNFVACGCNVRGVEKGDLTCNNTGSCNCRCDVAGDKCNMCQVGHQGFPDCDGMPTKKRLYMCI